MSNNSIFDRFTHQYPVTKTLRFALKPIGKTEENIKKKGLLKKDEDLSKKYKQAKKIIDEYHKNYINEKLTSFSFKIEDLQEFADIYHKLKENKNDDKLQESFKTQQDKLRKIVANQFKNKKLFDQDIIREDLPKWLKEKQLDIEDSQQVINSFYNWTTYFKGFNENRKNIYTEKEHSTSIGYRLIHENLPKFLNNIKRYEEAKKLGVDFSEVQNPLNVELDELFTLKGFNQCLTQEGIDKYNQIKGGQNRENHQKEQGINEKINLYAQQLERQIAKTDDEHKKELLKQRKQVRSCQLEELYKQILSDRNTASFRFDVIENDTDLCHKIQKAFYLNVSGGIIGQSEQKDEQTREIKPQDYNVTKNLKESLKVLNETDPSKTYIKNDRSVTDISQYLFGEYSLIQRCLEDYVEKKVFSKPEGKAETKGLLKQREQWLKQSYFSFDEIHQALELYFEEQYTDDELVNEQKSKSNDEMIKSIKEQRERALSKPLFEYFKSLKIKKRDKSNTFETIDLLENIKEKASKTFEILRKYENIKNEQIRSNTHVKDVIKTYLDTLIKLQHFLKPLYVKLGKKDEKRAEAYEKDSSFYSEFDRLFEVISQIIPLYNQTRNYLTKKPYSIEKYKLNFENSTLADGWDKNKEKDNTCILFMKDKQYFLGIIDRNHKNIFNNVQKDNKGDISYQKMIYKQIADAGKDIQNLMVIDGKTVMKKGRKEKKGPHTGENLQLEKLKNKYLPPKIDTIRMNNSYKKGDHFNKNDLESFIDYYKDRVNDYYESKFDFTTKDSNQYESFKEFTDHIDSQGYNITFQDISKGYIDQCVKDGKLYLFEVYSKDFSSRTRGKPNLQTLYWQSLFNESNLENLIYKLNGKAELFHRKSSIKYSKEIWEKGHHTDDPKKKQEYPIIKNRRYAKDTYLFHVPITCNFKASGAKEFNDKVNELLKNNPNVNIIGIDRGERHLAYYTLIDQKGKILEQDSFNDPFGNKNYRNLLEEKEKERDKARKSWDTIEPIKDLKAGYLSQVVHKITKLMIDNNAILVLEDLNFGFKRGRFKFEKQVYQKLEKALIDKLNYLVFKDKKTEDLGGLLRALQLTEKFDSFKKMGKQTGLIFYVPAYHTSKVCPATGFINLLYPRYETIHKTKEFFGKFDKICFNKNKDHFEFHFNYGKFINKTDGMRKDWIVCTHSVRLENFRNPEKNNQWDTREINLTQEMKNLLKENSIEFADGDCIKEYIIAKDISDFYKSLMRLLRLTLQMRNSKTGTDEDWLISPVKDHDGKFFDSRNIKDNSMPQNADANGAYHIALKGCLMLKQLSDKDVKNFKPDLSNKTWYEFIQNRNKIYPFMNTNTKENQDIKAKSSDKAQVA